MNVAEVDTQRERPSVGEVVARGGMRATTPKRGTSAKSTNTATVIGSTNRNFD